MSSLGAHLVQRITADLDFLKSQSLLSQSDYDSILARLPGPDGLRRAPLHEQLAMVTLSDPSPNGETARPMPPPLPGRPGSALSTGWGDGRPRCRAVWNYPMGQVRLALLAPALMEPARRPAVRQGRGDCDRRGDERRLVERLSQCVHGSR